ncbi:MAG: hypothetical protein HC882_01660 [Acidobacteria bacterium]|nr:hypothetical protein [Acidobacteriota bacterium]
MHGDDRSLDRLITTPEIQKPGLVLTGFVEFYHAERLQFSAEARSVISSNRRTGRRTSVAPSVQGPFPQFS